MIVAVDWPALVAGERASLRRFEGDAIAADWLEEAAQAIAGRADPCRLQARLDDGDQGWWILGVGDLDGDIGGKIDGQTAGRTVGRTVGALCGKLVELDDPTASRALIWTWLAVDARWRAYGYGGASVPLLEQAARSAGARIALAPLPPDNGVALYFWLRLGYTPIRTVAVEPSDIPAGVAADALWMQRPLGDEE